jgi:pyridoxamine 5'-phosphate oxidase
MQASLSEVEVGIEPILFFKKWFSEAESAEVHEVNAMTLATVDEFTKPHARIVLLKGVDDSGFTFFTNYQSAKGKNFEINPNAALVFFWPELERQVRIEGIVEKVSTTESDEYYLVRPRGSRLGAWASPQSEIISSRSILEENERNFEAQFEGKDIPRPEHWGGYRLKPTRIEFWQGRPSRMHDRICFEITKQGDWEKFRLAP